MAKKKSTSKNTTKKTLAKTTADAESSEPKQGRKKTRPATTSYSTRFDEAQRDLIEQAARIKQWSPAQLIREATIRRAADIVNASPPTDSILRELARRVAQQLGQPKGEVLEFNPDTGEDIASTTIMQSTELLDCYKIDIYPLPDEDMLQFQTALDTCASEFMSILKSELRSAAFGEAIEEEMYTPQIVFDRIYHRPNQIIGDNPDVFGG